MQETPKHMCIQIHTKLLTFDALEKIKAALYAMVGSEALEVEIELGDDGGPYMNYLFETNNLIKLWETVRRKIFEEKVIGQSIKDASIVTAEGESGWSDYLLLHHFDHSQKLDVLRCN